MKDDVRELIGRAIHGQFTDDGRSYWDMGLVSIPRRKRILADTDAVLSSLQEAGYVIVSRNPCTWPFNYSQTFKGHRYWCPVCGEGYGHRPDKCEGIGEPYDEGDE